MKITRLALKNIRCFREIVVDTIPQTVVLVAPNGAGKSTILEAISGVHELIQPYHRESYQFTQGFEDGAWNVWPQHLPDLLRAGAAEGEIEIQVEPSPAERALLPSDGSTESVAEARVAVYPERRVKVISANKVIKELFKYHSSRTMVGRLDQIRPQRVHAPRTAINTPDSLSDDHERKFFVEFSRTPGEHQKFSDLKTYINACLAADMATMQRTGEQRNTLAPFVDVFNQFFAPKQLLGLTEPTPGRFEITVSTPAGEHDIDYLSDGERDALNILARLFRFRALSNIVLWDTPELHLNAGLQSQLYAAIQRLAPGNQYWIATHSLELINSVPPESLFALRPSGDGISLSRISSSRGREKVALYRELGADVGFQLVSGRVVLVEGRDDESILRWLGREIPPLLHFVHCAGVRNLRFFLDRMIELSDDRDFFAVCDRDDLSDGDIAEFEGKKPGQIYVWRRRSLDNYLLDEQAIWQVISNWDSLRPVDAKQLTSPDDVAAALRAAADTTLDSVVAKRLESKLQVFRAHLKLDADNLLGSLERAYQRRVSSLEMISPDRRAALVAEVEREVRATWSNRWESDCLGKESLNAFLTKHFRDMNATLRATFKERLCAALSELARIPHEVQGVIKSLGT